mmetsp:Transcript_12280/g.30968  ORF Transcript_12280/g.30968 Transcript_12280/m.30968 type:complete len:908 (-) Transcript_12280:116-2839(-)
MAPKKKASAKAIGKDEEPAPQKEEPTVMKAAAKVMSAPKAAPEVEKRKADEKAEEPAKKEAKMEPKAKAAVKKEAESNPEVETDAPDDKRATLKDVVGFQPSDTTLNVISTMGGKVLMSLTEGGMQYLIAGARANVGMKAGRYMFEVKIVETLNPAEASAGARSRVPMPRQLLRIGFSAAASPLVLGDSEEHVFFDSEGSFWSGKKKTPAGQKFQRDQVIGVVLNLDPGSANANTLSIFREGQRISEPQPIPESLHGKTLFPHVSFRNVSLQVFSGKDPAMPLPFKCRAIGGAAEADVVKAASNTPKGGKYEVMLPVAFPDQGTFDWLDTFLAANPQYVELSDRKIIEWAASSGLLKPKAGPKHSNDKPEFNYGLPSMDDLSVRRVLNRVAPLVPRNYVVMEVKSNLIEAERKEILSRFNSSQFTKAAHVIMGEPTEEFKQMRLDKLLKDKQEKADAAWKAKKAEEKRKKEAAEKQKHLNEMRKKAEEARKKAAAEAKKKADEAKKKAEADKKKAEAAKRKAEAKKKAEEAGEEYIEEEEEEEDDEVKDEDQMDIDEDIKEEVKDEKDDEMEEEEEETEPPSVELTDEEKKMWMQPTSGSSDLTSAVLSQSFGKFTIPEQAEGFDELRFEWQGQDQSKDYLRQWVKERKRSSRIDDLQPGQWFQDKLKEWKGLLTQWQTKQKTYKVEEKKKLEAKKKATESDGDKAEDEESMEDEVNVFEVVDVCDVGNGKPLFKDFEFEDWALLQLRFELHLLQVAFKKDVDDPERVGVHDTHLSFYYSKYFRKQLTPKNFNVASNVELTTLVKDTVSWDEEEKVLRTPLEEDLTSNNIFVQLAEDNRRERVRRIEAGDETARLKFSPLALQQTPAAKATGAPPVAAGVVRPAGTWAGNNWGAGGAWAGNSGWGRW